jgi:hypothetical protein
MSGKAGKLLELLARRSQYFGDMAPFHASTDYPLIDAVSTDEAAAIAAHLRDIGLLRQPSGSECELTMDGWNRVQPLPRSGGIPGRCFVAMWFSDVTRAAYESGIEPAVKEAGFMPIRIDRKEHNNEIPDEIMAEIRNCEFMVADFTGQRAGVY